MFIITNLCNLFIALVVSRRFLVAYCSKTATKDLLLTTESIYLCIFSPSSAMDKSQRMVVMDKFSFSVRKCFPMTLCVSILCIWVDLSHSHLKHNFEWLKYVTLRRLLHKLGETLSNFVTSTCKLI